MPIQGTEIVGSREGNMSVENPSVELMFKIWGDYDDALIRAALEYELPPYYVVTSAFFGSMRLVLQSYRYRQMPEGGPNFEGSATYGRTQPRKTGQLWFSFDGTGGSAHIQTSLQTVNRYGRNDVQGPPTGVAVTLNSSGLGGGGGLVESTLYSWGVTAIGLAGETTISASASATATATNKTAQITWNAVTGATSYKIYRHEAFGSFTSPCFMGSTTGLSYTDQATLPSAGAPPSTFTPQQVPDFERAIGVSGDSVEGCDKIIPFFKFRLDYYPATALMTPAYILALYNLQARPVNEQEVDLGGILFSPGTLLYLGPTGQPRGFDDWELGLSFIASPNVTGINVGEIQGIAKGGHDYLWFRFMDAVRSQVGIKVPQFAYVERIYDKGNFSTLGLDGIPIQGLAGA